MMAESPSVVRRSGALRPERSSRPAGALVAKRFRLTRVLGAGGMGTVYEAVDTTIDRKVAIKLLRSEYNQDPVMAARFEREARAVSRITSPSVVTIHDFGRDPEQGLYMVMELLSGEALGSLLDRSGSVFPHTAAHIAIQIAEALAAAHEVGIVHRDLKPDNVWLLHDGGLKVLDFGIARVLEPGTGPVSTTLTQVGVILGTPLYISPEAVARKKVGPTADLYALGVILFEMIAGEPPFVDDEPTVLCTMHLRNRPPRLLDKRGDTPPEIDALVARLLEKDPRNRPQDAREVITRLAQVTWVESDPTERAPAPFPEPALPARLVPTVDLTATIREPPKFVPWWRSRRAIGAGLALAAALLLAVVIASSHGGVDPSPSRSPPPAETRAPPPAATMEEARIDTEVVPPIGEAPPVDVVVRVSGLPDGAELRWDGEPVTNPFRVPRDGRRHRLDASAPGHEPRALEVMPEGDLLIPLALLPRQRRPGKRPVKLQPWTRGSRP